MTVRSFDSILGFWISVIVIKLSVVKWWPVTIFFSSWNAVIFLSMARLVLCGAFLAGCWKPLSLTDTWLVSMGVSLQEIWVHTSAGSLRVILRKPLPLSLMQAFWCWVCVLHFIRLNKLINSADSERLHNLSNVNSHLNYPNFILNLQNPITG